MQVLSFQEIIANIVLTIVTIAIYYYVLKKIVPKSEW